MSNLAKLEAHNDVISGLALSPNEEYLASCSKDKYFYFLKKSIIDKFY